METKPITSNAIWYHVSTWSGDSASRWATGAARKGNYDGRTNISVIQFKASDLAEAIGSGRLAGADLVLRRDATYGTAAMDVCLAPIDVSGSLADKYMSRNQALEMVRRPMHKRYTIQGESAVFAIPGAMLREIKAGNANAFILYQETDGTDSYCRLSTSAVLNLYVGNDWMTPSWTRSVTAGDVISSDVYSHVADLREIEYYINQRRAYNSLPDMADIGANLDVGAYEDWADVILALQAGADGFLTAEERTVDWTVPNAGQMPSAEIVEQLKASVDGQDEGRNRATGFTAFQTSSKAGSAFSPGKSMTWKNEDPVKAGVIKTSMVVRGSDGVNRTVTTWEAYVCGWIFEQLTGRAITAATLEVAVKKADAAQPHLSVYGITASAKPTSASYYNTFHSELIGETDANVGEVAKIVLTAKGLQLLNAGTIHGLGLRYDNDYVEIAAEARLLVNAETIEEQSEE